MDDVESVARAVLEVGQGPPDLENLARAISEAAKRAGQEGGPAAGQVLAIWSPRLDAPGDPYVLALLARGCGALVEYGASPEPALPAVRRRLADALPLAAEFRNRCAQRAGDDADADPLEQHGHAVAEQEPGLAAAWDTIEHYALAAVAMLSRSKALRARMAADRALCSALEDLGDDHGTARCLQRMLQVLDDAELVVLHEPTRRGFRLQVEGVGDNFQLHTLLADALIGDEGRGLLPGARPDPEEAALARDAPPANGVSACGHFNLLDGHAVRRDRSLCASHEHWIWNEGCPADIPAVLGSRVVILTPPPYVRTWNAGRLFPGLPARVEVVEHLAAAAVESWFGRLAEASPAHEHAPEATPAPPSAPRPWWRFW